MKLTRAITLIVWFLLIVAIVMYIRNPTKDWPRDGG
jgi:hypothetical protein